MPKDQAKAISLVVRKSHEVADLATKRDLDDVRKDLSADIAEVKREIADVRKDIGQIDKRLDFAEKRFDRLQWFLLAGILSLLFKDVLPKLWGG
ncbi:hypothetical protein [Symbiopectobacterium sp. RP]|uniref:hypothetical protein n=1 Tax=Symbiopectobacterium sp. RP TaxID=3248553 RepID=UPI003D26768B